MGGFGSGRCWYRSAKDTIDDFRRIDVRRWQRDRLLTPGHAFNWQWSSRDGEVVASIGVRVETGRVVLSYRHRSNGGAWVDKNYPVLLVWTPCNFGGARPWFRCPARACGRRVAILYASSIFVCRHCLRLAYPVQRERDDDRAARRADKIRQRLGWEPGILNGQGDKPPRMHWTTFERLQAEHNAFVSAWQAGWEQWLGLANRRLDNLLDAP